MALTDVKNVGYNMIFKIPFPDQRSFEASCNALQPVHSVKIKTSLFYNKKWPKKKNHVPLQKEREQKKNSIHLHKLCMQAYLHVYVYINRKFHLYEQKIIIMKINTNIKHKYN